MRQKLIAIAVTALLGPWFNLAYADEGHKHNETPASKEKTAESKNDKQLRTVFPKATSFEEKRFALSKSQVSKIQKAVKGKLSSREKKSRFFIALGKKNEVLGTVVFFGAKDVDNDPIPAAVGIGTDGKVEKVVVFSHHDDNPWADVKFLSQFIGKGAKDSWKAGDTFQLIDEAKSASWQVVKGIRKALLIHQYVGKKGVSEKRRKLKEMKTKHHEEGKDKDEHAHEKQGDEAHHEHEEGEKKHEHVHE